MKRVLQIMGGLNRGGLETFVMNVYRVVNRREIQFDFLLTQSEGGDYEGEALSLGAKIFHIPARNKGYAQYRKALDEFFKQHHNYIAIHEHVSSLTTIESAYYAKKYGISVRILHSHSSSVQKSLSLHRVHVILHYLNKPKVHSWFTHYLGCSDKALDWMYRYTGVRSQALMFNNGIDSQQYRYDEKVREEVRMEFNFGKKDFVIGHVGRFIPLKNQAFLIDVLEEFHHAGLSSAKLILVGEGETRHDVKVKAEKKGLTDAVFFTGVRTDVNRLMQAMDVFVMPSWFEGLPVSLVEAQAAGLPILASSTISHDSDLTGTILFKSIDDSPAEWTRCIVEWKGRIGRPDNVEKIRKAGFDSRDVAQQLVGIYRGYIL